MPSHSALEVTDVYTVNQNRRRGEYVQEPLILPEGTRKRGLEGLQEGRGRSNETHWVGAEFAFHTQGSVEGKV